MATLPPRLISRRCDSMFRHGEHIYQKDGESQLYACLGSDDNPDAPIYLGKAVPVEPDSYVNQQLRLESAKIAALAMSVSGTSSVDLLIVKATGIYDYIKNG